MRILVLENEPSSRRGGQELSLLDVCRGLASRGHAIELLYRAGGDLLGEYAGFTARQDRVSAYAIDRSRALVSAARLAGDLVQAGRTAPDVIYANQYLDSLFGRLLAWRFQRPFVCHLRLPPPDVFCGQYRWGMAGPSRLIAISRQTREDYVARGFRRDRIDVVHNGLDVAQWVPASSAGDVRARFGLPREARLVVFAGRLHPAKGLETLIDALALLPEDVHAAIAGREIADGRRDDYAPHLAARVAVRGVGARCHFLGHVPRIADLYGAAEAVVLPSVVSEAFGRSVVEAMACGVPAVAAKIGGVPEVLTGEFASLLFTPGDAAALASRLEAIAGWRVRDPQLARRCREHVARHFSIAQTIDGVEEVLRRTVAEWRSGTRTHAAGEIVRSPKPCASA
ncbi:MAG: glycosyltransferase family 4 protein [Acidobacteria bacterium]|nr:glycosyltransferase family 4 protein [Acidobacteriota bacterium]